MKKIELDKGYRELEIGGEVFRMDLSDEKWKQQQRKKKEILDKSAEFQNANEENEEKLLDELHDFMEESLDSVLEPGSFKKIYHMANQSIFAVVNVFADVMDYLEQERNTKVEAQKAKYVK